MDDLNTVILCGRLTRDMEISYTTGGYAIGKASLAVNSSRKKGDAWEEEVSFFNITLWGKRAEGLQQYLKKGTQIVISGRLKQDRWNDAEGKARTAVNINVDHVQLVGGKRKDGEGTQTAGTAEAKDFQDDVPF